MTARFNYQAALNDELERQFSALQAIMRIEETDPEQGATEAIVDMASLLLAYTMMAERGVSPFETAEDLDHLVNVKMTGFFERVLAAGPDGAFEAGKNSNLQPSVLSDLHKDVCEIADLIRAWQVAAHLPEHLRGCDPETMAK